jgi:hypothetical protein
MKYNNCDDDFVMVCVNCKDCKHKHDKLFCENMYSDFYKDEVDAGFWCDEFTNK